MSSSGVLSSFAPQDEIIGEDPGEGTPECELPSQNTHSPLSANVREPDGLSVYRVQRRPQ